MLFAITHDYDANFHTQSKIYHPRTTVVLCSPLAEHGILPPTHTQAAEARTEPLVSCPTKEEHKCLHSVKHSFMNARFLREKLHARVV